MEKYLSVTTLTKYLKMKFDKDPYLERVYLTGQVSNFRKRPTHQYFSLKDDRAVIQATIWSGIYQKLGFDLEEGMKINVIGRVQVYEPSGSYSIIIEKAEPDGVGALAIQFEQLKKKLSEEGLFQDRFKQAIPQFVKKLELLLVVVELLSRISLLPFADVSQGLRLFYILLRFKAKGQQRRLPIILQEQMNVTT
ncbi:putative exodeoxyribonuclease VII, large subunit [Streptococcus infantis SK970]|nr:putative exodeoxyribonuclease VII, large subunit [Streptococcus infantis SK970]